MNKEVVDVLKTLLSMLHDTPSEGWFENGPEIIPTLECGAILSQYHGITYGNVDPCARILMMRLMADVCSKVEGLMTEVSNILGDDR